MAFTFLFKLIELQVDLQSPKTVLYLLSSCAFCLVAAATFLVFVSSSLAHVSLKDRRIINRRLKNLTSYFIY